MPFPTHRTHAYTASRLYIFLLLLSFVWCCEACNEQTDEKPIGTDTHLQSVPFSVPTELVPQKTDTRRVDVDKDGYEDAIVLAYPKDSLSARIGFETVRIYEYDTTKKQFRQAFQGKYYYGTTIDVRDLDRNGTNELCIRTDGGGNSATASIGMTVLSKTAGKYTTLAAFDFGNPDLITLAGDSTVALLGNDEYFPEYLPPSEAVIVPDSLVVFAQTPERASTLRAQYFTDAAKKARERYTQAKATVNGNRSSPALFAAYSEAVVTMRLLAKLPDAKPLQEFILQERPFWRAMLPKRLHDALDDVFRPHP